MKYFLLFMTVCMVLCCKKDDTTNSPTNIDYLTQASWKLDVAGLDADGNGTIDISEPLKPCELDDSFTFAKGGTGTFDNGATKCNDTDPQTSSFVWSLQNKTIAANIPGILAGSATLNMVNATSMELWKDTTVVSISTRIIVKLKH